MKNWLITGVSRGLGKALAEAALARGDTVIGTVREGNPDIAQGNGAFHPLLLDVRDPKAIETAVSRAFDLVDRLDVVVNNAGYGLLGPVEAVTDTDMTRLFEVNVFGPLRVIRAVLPRLRAQRSGHIINITSIAGRAPNAGSGVYSATKAALEGLSQSLWQELRPLGIHVSAVAPGAFRTDFLTDHSIRQTSLRSEDYATSVGTIVTALRQTDGRQIGDPERCAQGILAVVDSNTPPLHLLLGSDALRRARVKLDQVIDEMDQWEQVTRSTDFP
ncbi:MAG: SDR family NAD(P)-dependent oxidoreductase [Proteobacteria bacterium]|nr:SDR family NAD(P)-dependent oxidoreductase [Pseudomonadota bacterium]